MMPQLARMSLPLWLRIFTGALAGLGFCIKPHCLVVFAGIQLLYFIGERSLRILFSIENMLIYAVGALYLALVWWITPEYFSTIVRMALKTYSETRDENPILFYAGNALSVLVLTFAMFRFGYTSPYRKDIYYLTALLPFFFLYALVNNNWAYTYYPLSSLALIITGFVWWEFLYLKKEFLVKRLPTWTFTVGAWACFLSFAIRIVISVNYFFMVLNDACYNNVHCGGDDRFVAEVAGVTHPHSFGAISIEFSRWTRLSFYSGAAWETRFPQLWMLPKFLTSDEAFKRQNQWILDYVGNALADDMDRNKPDVMFVDDTNIVYAKYTAINLMTYFTTNPHFEKAWSHYRYLHRIDLCGAPPPDAKIVYKSKCSYDVYRRIK
jgi:hypothetical protein